MRMWPGLGEQGEWVGSAAGAGCGDGANQVVQLDGSGAVAGGGWEPV